MDFRNDPIFAQVTSQLEQSRGLPAGILTALVGVESGGNSKAVSPVGARGLTQFMPETAKQYDVDVNDPVDSLRGTADYLQDLIHKYDGNVKAALSHYNGGGHNARYQVDGTVPAADKVSPKNFAVNQKYVNDISSKLDSNGPDERISQVNAYVTGLAKSGASPDLIINQLMKNPITADLVSQGMKAGESPEKIVATLGGPEYAPIAAAQAKINSQAFGTNLVQGAGAAVGDVVEGAKQLTARATGNNAWLTQLQKQQAEREADPQRRALAETGGATVANMGVKAVPYIAAALVPEVGLPAMAALQGAAGAVDGALTPTTGEGQFGANVRDKSVVGALTGGAGYLGGKVVSNVAAKALSATPEQAAAIAQRAAQQEAQGIKPTAATLTERGRAWNEANPGSKYAQAAAAETDAVLAGKIADGLGVTGYTGAIDSNLLNTARSGIQKTLDDATNINVTLPTSIKTDLGKMLGSAENPLTTGIATNSTVKQAAANIVHAAESGTPVSGRQLQQLASELKAITQNQAASASERTVAGQMVNRINTALTDAMTPEQAAAFAQANKQYSNLKAVEKMVAASNDSGLVTPRQMLNAVKTGRFRNQFLRGEAPYQELSGVASDALGPAGNRGLTSAVAKALGGSDLTTGVGIGALADPITGLGAVAVKKLLSGALSKAANSSNETIVKLLTGTTKGQQKLNDPVVRQFIAKALGTTAAATED